MTFSKADIYPHRRSPRTGDPRMAMRLAVMLPIFMLIAPPSFAAGGGELWSLLPVRDPEPPEVQDKSWPASAVDRFVLARLEQNGLRPNRQADGRTLIRRLFFDLVGLPPKPRQITEFLKDESPDAYERLVDRLLASPQFGERWGRHWLDIARFAESSGGGRALVFPYAWRYRDYVIRAYNRDKPFDEFVIEQIAGDLLESDSIARRRDQLVATGLLLLGPTNYELQDKELLRMEVVDEQIDTIGRAFLGLTIGCARCHDHKFDPISTREYYSLAGIFRSTKTLTPGNVSGYETRELPLPAERQARWEAYRADLEDREAELAKAKKSQQALEKQLTTLKTELERVRTTGEIVDDTQAETVGTWQRSTHDPKHFGTHYVHDQNEGKGQKSIVYTPNLPGAGRYEVLVSYSAGSSRADGVPVLIEHADGETQVMLNQQTPQPIEGQWASLGTFPFAAGTSSSVTISNEGTEGYVIADAVRFVPSNPSDNNRPRNDPKIEHKIDELRPSVLAARKGVKELQKSLEDFRRSAPEAPPIAMTIREQPPEEMGDWRVCIRGDVRNLGDEVPRGFLHAASSDSRTTITPGESGRRELAAWLASDANPLTARVYANRIWVHLIGEGIVRTPDNFGTMGQRPSHPELLDWLASRLKQDGWSTKSLIRRIVTSRTYRLSSRQNPQAAAVDPENLLLARAHRKRLEAEAIRDAILAISGRLQREQGGPVVPDDLKSEFNYKFNSRRRSIYIAAFRNRRHELLEVFDASNPNVVTGMRTESTLPTQALYMMNSPFVLEQAEAAARRLLADKDLDTRGRIVRAYHETLGRNPTTGELDLVHKFVTGEGDPVIAYSQLYQTLFGSIDFRYLE